MSPVRAPLTPPPPAQPRRHAKVFWTGRSQAIRLPKEFRFSVSEVMVHREGNNLVVEPSEIPRDTRGWPLAWWDLAGAAPELDLGDRKASHERRDPLAPRKKR